MAGRVGRGRVALCSAQMVEYSGAVDCRAQSCKLRDGSAELLGPNDPYTFSVNADKVTWSQVSR